MSPEEIINQPDRHFLIGSRTNESTFIRQKVVSNDYYNQSGNSLLVLQPTDRRPLVKIPVVGGETGGSTKEELCPERGLVSGVVISLISLVVFFFSFFGFFSCLGGRVPIQPPQIH